MATVDVTVLGAGVMGLCVAHACLMRGARVRVIDPAGPGAGASGGQVGALAPHVPDGWNAKKAFQFAALSMAERFWAEVAAQGGVDPGYARLGRIQPAGDPALARARGDAASINWQGLATWEVIPAPTGHWRPVGADWLIRDTLSARIAPRRAVASLVAAVQALGGTLERDGQVRGAVVEATGHAGLRALIAGTGPTDAGEKGQAALLAFDARDRPQIFADGVHIVPQADGTTAIGSTSERTWEDAACTDQQLDDLINKAQILVPVLTGAPVVARWAGIRPRWSTRAPLLGTHPTREGAFIANGGYKIGFAIAPLAGQLLAELILTGHNTTPPAFRPA